MSMTIIKEGLRDGGNKQERRRTRDGQAASSRRFVICSHNESPDNEEYTGKIKMRGRWKNPANVTGEKQWTERLREYVRKHFGVIMAFTSCFFHALGSIGVKMLAGRIPPTEVAVVRLVFYFTSSSVLLVYSRVSLRIMRHQVIWVLLRVTAGTVAMCLSFYAYQNIPVGDTVAIFYSSPIFTGIFAWIILREKFTVADAALAIIALIGIVLIARPSFLFVGLETVSSKDGNTRLGVTCAVGGALFASLVYVLIRKLGGIMIHPFVQIWYFGLTGIILTTTLTTIFGLWTMPQCGRERIVLILTGLIGFFGQLCMTVSFRFEKASYVAMIKTNGVIMAFLFEFAFFGTVPFWLSVVGAIMIVFSSFGITVKKWWSTKNKKEDDESVSEAERVEENFIKDDDE